jgi:hypothetical protein
MAANGYLDLVTLTKVDGWAYLETNTANAWVAACDELVSLGYPRPTISAPDGAYRTYAQQQYWATYWANQGKPGNASTPGYSNHGFGTCVDVWNATIWPQDVLRSTLAKHGFAHDFAPEVWHFHHTTTNPADNSHTIIAAASIPTLPIQTITKDTEMAEPIIIKGDIGPEISAFYTNVSDASTPGPGPVFKARRPITPAEWAIYTTPGTGFFPHPKQVALIILPQAQYDSINTVHA